VAAKEALFAGNIDCQDIKVKQKINECVKFMNWIQDEVEVIKRGVHTSIYALNGNEVVPNDDNECPSGINTIFNVGRI
jgi:hypothetical protein